MSVTLLDVILVLVILGFFGVGLARGIWITLGGVVGFLIGASAAFFAIPVVAGWVPDPVWRVVAVIGAAIVLVVAGHALGSAAGTEMQRMFKNPTLQRLGSLVGGVLNLVVAVVVISALSFSVQAMGFPAVNQHMRQSAVLQTINGVMPEATESWFAQLRGTVMASDIPEIAQLLVPESSEAPETMDLTAAAEETAGAVARITGTAHQCGQSQSGSGFAITPTRVVTNAHVIAGVGEPSVELPGGQVVTGRAVYFNPNTDLALLAVDPVDVPSVDLGAPLDPGAPGFVMGYPAGGPFSAGSALVQARDVSEINSIYGGSPSTLEIYQVNADVRQGNSGGPLVDTDGNVVGVIFARAMEGNAVGFAITAEAAGEVLTEPEGFVDTVSTGQCVER
ncbi:MarP family serine protease [Nesterenkonia flava]|uniref:MarP family serine protease n=1 Tax=Nesterenkonia flava TaxID=469799 RepID=A0ABU1FUJ9_9MICC|nr:MarP family serine protease [Nesterenkonia flava]MDR5712313.1 MarP family serine protease [Nesterenkonia flava]